MTLLCPLIIYSFSMTDSSCYYFVIFFFNATATTDIYTYLHTLSLHDALPIPLLMAARCPWPHFGQHFSVRGALIIDSRRSAADSTAPSMAAAAAGPKGVTR